MAEAPSPSHSPAQYQRRYSAQKVDSSPLAPFGIPAQNRDQSVIGIRMYAQECVGRWRGGNPQSSFRQGVTATRSRNRQAQEFTSIDVSLSQGHPSSKCYGNNSAVRHQRRTNSRKLVPPGPARRSPEMQKYDAECNAIECRTTPPDGACGNLHSIPDCILSQSTPNIKPRSPAERLTTIRVGRKASIFSRRCSRRRFIAYNTAIHSVLDGLGRRAAGESPRSVNWPPWGRHERRKPPGARVASAAGTP